MKKAKPALSITKRSGEKVAFEPGKLRRSLKRSGARDQLIEQVVESIENQLYEGISTKEIYKKAFQMIRRHSKPVAARYNLKKAIFDLGPTGFPFEVFIAELLFRKGFETETGKFVQGVCVQHEVDVIAQKGNKRFMVECKFHSDHSRHCDVKVPLYIQSRFKDIEAQWLKNPESKGHFHQGWVVTNTRFTTDAIDYAQCSGLQLLSWDYPLENNLRQWIDETGAHPVTCLTSLSKSDKQKLLDEGVVSCRQLCEQPQLLDKLGYTAHRTRNILDEMREICKEFAN